MAQIPVDVWHVNKELMTRLRAEKTEEAKRLFRKLDNREFFSNALSYLFSISLVIAIIITISLFGSSYVYPEQYFYPIIATVVAFLSKWGSDKLKSSATAILIDYFKQKQKNSKSNKNIVHKNSKK